MTAPPRPQPEVGWLLRRLCALLGHGCPARLLDPVEEFCACGADHSYTGCARCGVYLNTEKWW